MTEPPFQPVGPAGAPPAPSLPPPAAPAAPAAPDSYLLPGRWIVAGGVLLAALSGAAAMYAWNAQQRVKSLEQQLVKRQEDSGAQAAEAQVLAKRAQDDARESAARVALLEARVADVAVQRTQLDDLIQSLTRTRDENLLAEIDASIRVAMQQTAITGSAEPLMLALRQADDRLARQNQPRLQGVRRALAQDLERLRATGTPDASVLALRLDEVIRMVDELPLLSTAERRGPGRSPPQPPAAPVAEPDTAPADSGSWAGMRERMLAWWRRFVSEVWDEARSLIRVTRIEQPEAMLVAPDQAYFLRENLKLRLLDARLALMSRQFETAQADLRDVQAALERYFDHSSKRVAAAQELVRQVSAQARQVVVPRPDATLAAIAAVTGAR